MLPYVSICAPLTLIPRPWRSSPPPFGRPCLEHSSPFAIILPSGHRDPSSSFSCTSLGGKSENSFYLLVGLHRFSQTSKVTMRKQISKSSAIENLVMGRRNGSAVKSTYCFCTECGFESQHSRGLTTINNSSSRKSKISLVISASTRHEHGAHAHRQNIYTQIFKN